MKVDNVCMLKKMGSKVYIGRMDGLVMEFTRTTSPTILLHLDNVYAPMALAIDAEILAIGGLEGDDSRIFIKKIDDNKIIQITGDVRFFIGTNFFVGTGNNTLTDNPFADNTEFCLCELTPNSGVTPRMPLDLLDSEPLVYDVDTACSPLLAIARRGTIYTIDCSRISSYYPFTFSIIEGEIIEKMRGQKNKGVQSDKHVGIIEIEYGDGDDDDTMIAEDKYFDEIIDPRLPIRAHNPGSNISSLKLVNLRNNDSPLVVSASNDHHITVHDFSSHKKLFDSGWIETVVFCNALSGKKVIFGGRSGGVVILDLENFNCREYALPIKSALYQVNVSDDKAAFYTSDNSVIIVDLNTLHIIDAIAPSVRLVDMCLLGNNLFMLNEEFELTIEQI